MWEILKTKASELPISWIKGVIILFLGMTVMYYYVSIRQVGVALQTLQFNNQSYLEALNGQCEEALTRQGFQVIKPKPTAPPPPEEGAEEKGDAKR